MIVWLLAIVLVALLIFAIALRSIIVLLQGFNKHIDQKGNQSETNHTHNKPEPNRVVYSEVVDPVKSRNYASDNKDNESRKEPF